MRVLCCMVFAGTVAVTGCSTESSGTLPLRPSPGPAPQPSGIQVTATVIGHERPGAGSPRSAVVSVWFDRDEGGGTGGRHTTGSDGSFTISAPTDTRAVRFLAEASGFVQPCLATLRLTGASTSYAFDVHVVRESALPQLRTFDVLRGALVEGFVYETTPSGRRGVGDAAILVDGDGGMGLVIADTLSDDQGRFVLCGFEGETSAVLFAVKAGYELATVNLPVGPELVEIELKR